ncbi:MAG: sensor histidine kinase [Caldilineaceae bacterium]
MALFLYLKDLKGRLIFALSCVALLSILSFGCAAYFSERGALVEDLRADLNSTANFQKRQIIAWLTECLADVQMLAMNRSSRDNLSKLLALDSTTGQTNLSDNTAGNKRRTMTSLTTLLTNQLVSLQRSRVGYSRIVIADHNGRVRVTTDPGLMGQSLASDSGFQGTLNHGEGIYIQDIHAQPANDQYVMDFGYIISRDLTVVQSNLDQVLGVVLITVDVKDALFPLLRGWHIGKSGEVVLEREQNNTTLVINKNLVLMDKSSLKPMRLPTGEHEGAIETVDYKNTPVLAIYRQIDHADVPGIRWNLIFKKDISELYAPLYTLVEHLAVIAIGVLGIAVLVSLKIAKTLTKPLATLVHATQVVATGNWKTKIEIHRDDEIGMLAHSFQEMLDVLEQRQHQLETANEAVRKIASENAQLVEQLQALNADLEVKIEERTKDLAEANTQLKRLDQMKSAFLLNVSHELRSPVTSLKFNIDLLQRELIRTNSMSGKSERYLATLTKHIDFLARLIEDMLNLLQLEHESDALEFTTVDLNMIVETTLMDYQTPIDVAGLTLIYKPAAYLPSVKADPARIVQMLTCLLNNAIAYNHTKGQIGVSTRFNDNQQVGIEIKDTGIGISSEDIPHIFERFYRGTVVNESAIPGTGLGLSIVKEIINLHNGRIEVESQLGKGACFTVWLPVDEADRHVNPRPAENYALGNTYVLPKVAERW